MRQEMKHTGLRDNAIQVECPPYLPDRMPLAPETEKLLRNFRSQPAMQQTPVAQLRKPRERIGAVYVQSVGAVDDLTIDATEDHSIALRVYAPPATTTLLPLVLLMHGGGFVIGGIDGYYDQSAGCCAQRPAARWSRLDTSLHRSTSFRPRSMTAARC
jgi:acetyl esterase/lipase